MVLGKIGQHLQPFLLGRAHLHREDVGQGAMPQLGVGLDEELVHLVHFLLPVLGDRNEILQHGQEAAVFVDLIPGAEDTNQIVSLVVHPGQLVLQSSELDLEARKRKLRAGSHLLNDFRFQQSRDLFQFGCLAFFRHAGHQDLQDSVV